MVELKLDDVFGRVEEALKREASGARVEVELLLERAESLSLSVQKGALEKFDSSRSGCAGFRVLLDGIAGYAWSEDLSESALLTTARHALENARFAAQGAEESDRVELISDGQPIPEDASLFNDSLRTLDFEGKKNRALELESMTLQADPRVQSVPYNGYSEVEYESRIYTSRGVRRRQRRTSVSGSSYCLARDGESTKMAGEGFFVRDSASVNIAEVAQEAARRATSRLGATVPATGRYPLVIDSKVAGELVGLLAGSFSAKAVFEKNSLLAGKMGERIASACLSLMDDPRLPGAAGSRSFDSEGATARATPLLRDGVLTGYLTDSVHARKMGLPHTASASRGPRSELDISYSNLVVPLGQKSLEELLASQSRVIYITEFKGYHSSYQKGSGDFSFPSEGELWDNGKRIGPVADFVTSGNLLEILMSIEEVGRRLHRPDGSVRVPDLLVIGKQGGLMVAGK